MPSTCCVDTCYYTKKVVLVRFPNPKRRLDLFNKWMEVIEEFTPSILELSPDAIYERRRICLEHFEERWIQRYASKGFLKDGAVPTIFLSKEEQLRRLRAKPKSIETQEQTVSLRLPTPTKTVNETKFLEELFNETKEVIHIPPVPKEGDLEVQPDFIGFPNALTKSINDTNILEELLSESKEVIHIPPLPVPTADDSIQQDEDTKILDDIQTVSSLSESSEMLDINNSEISPSYSSSTHRSKNKNVWEQGRVSKVKDLSEKAKNLYELAKKMKQRYAKNKVKRLQNNIEVT